MPSAEKFAAVPDDYITTTVQQIDIINAPQASVILNGSPNTGKFDDISSHHISNCFGSTRQRTSLSFPCDAPQSGLLAPGTIFTYAGRGISGSTGDGSQATSAYLSAPRSVSVDAMTGNLYIVDKSRIRLVTKSTGIITTVAGTVSRNNSRNSGDGGLAVLASLSSPWVVTADPLNGNIYIADNTTIRMVTKSTGIITTIAGINTRRGYTGDGGLAVNATLFYPRGIAVDPSSGDLYISDTYNDAIRMITKSTGVITTIAGTGQYGYTGDGGPATLATLSFPKGVAVDSATGNIYIADCFNSVIRMITKSTGIITTIAGTGKQGYSGDGGLATLARFFWPSDVAVDASSGDVVIVESSNQAIRMVTKNTGIITTIAGTGKQGYSGDGGPATSATLFNPYRVALDSSSRVMYIADTDNFVVRNVIGSPSTEVSSPKTASTSAGE